jgi:hypothetical protein
MKVQITSIKGTTSVHETTEGRVKGRIGTKGNSNVRQAIIDGNRHECERWTGSKSMRRKRLDKLDKEAGTFLNGDRWPRRKRTWSSKCWWKGQKMGWNGKGLSDRCTGCGWQYLMRKRGFLAMRKRRFLATVRLVRKQMLEESGRSSRGIVLGAASKNMVSRATEYTTAKTQRVAALKVGKWVSREGNGPRQRRGLVTLDGLLRRGHERMGKGRDIVRMTRGSGKSSRGMTSIINGRSRRIDGGSNGEWSGQGRRKVFQFSVNSVSNQFLFLVGFLNVVMTNSSPLEECRKSIKLRSTISKTRKIRCDVHGVDTQDFLKFQRKGIMILTDKIQTPEEHIRRKQRSEVGVFIKEFIRGKIGPMTRGRIAERHRQWSETQNKRYQEAEWQGQL